MRGIMPLLLLQARRDRVLLPVWILGIGLLGFVTSTAVAREFGAEADRAAIVAVAAANPAFLFLRGLPDGLGVGAVAFFQGYAFTAVLAGLMSTFLVVRHTRADEELGRAELVASVPLPRAASLMAAILLGAGANLALLVVVAAGFAGAGLPWAGSLTAGAAVAAVGLFFVAVAAAAAQAMPSARGANGAAAGLVAGAYLLRGVGDALGTPNADLTRVASGWVSAFSPIGWGQRSRPFSAADPVPLLALAALAAVLATAVAVAASRRDLGASLLPERMGRSRGSKYGATLLGLAWRLQRPTLVGWCLGAAVLGAFAGALGPLVTDAVAGNAALEELISGLLPGSRVEVVDLLLAALLGIAGVLGAAAGIQAILRLRAEESEGRAELLLAVPRSRVRWLAANLFLAFASVGAVSTAAGMAASIFLSFSGPAPVSGLPVAAAVSHVPAALVFVSATALAFAVRPRMATSLGWGSLALGLVLGQFGDMMRLPMWLQNLSPFNHSAAMPVEPFDAGAALWLGAIAIAGAGCALLLLRRRDLAG